MINNLQIFIDGTATILVDQVTDRTVIGGREYNVRELTIVDSNENQTVIQVIADDYEQRTRS